MATINEISTAPAACAKATLKERMARLIEPCVWSVALVLLCFCFAYTRGPGLSNDGYQYLSVAKNIQEHGEAGTSIVYFDSERVLARLPAPETTAPPGYPIAIALLSLLPTRPETAGWILSLFGVTAVIPLLWWGAGILGATDGTKRLGVGIWFLNSHVILYGRSVAADAIFTCVVLAGILSLLFAEIEERHSKYLVPFGMFLLGLSYWIRYAGVFVVAAVCVYSVWRLVTKRPYVGLWMASLVFSFVMIASNVARNARITGRVGVQRGGILHPLHTVLRNFLAAWFHLFFGDSRVHLGLIHSTVILLITLILLLVLSSNKLARTSPPKKVHWELLGAVVVVYSGGIMYAQTYTPLELGSRYFFPLVPMVILAMIGAFSWFGPLRTPTSQKFVPALSLLLICAYGAANIMELQRANSVSPHARLDSYFAEPTGQGEAASAWVQHNIPAQGVIVATEGQATAYLLQRPTVCLTSWEYTNQRWNDDSVHQLMQTYNAAFLIVYAGLPTAGESDSVEHDSEFIRALSNEEYPDWLVLAARTPHLVIYQLH